MTEENVRVVVRVRPLSVKEIDKGCKIVTKVNHDTNSVNVANPNDGKAATSFSFDAVFQDAEQTEIYNKIARPLVESVMEGYNATIFAYGQTGTGKTYTMEGEPTPEKKGIIPNSFAQIFTNISKASGDTRFLVRVSHLEIYNEEVRDLLAKDHTKKLDLKKASHRGVYVKVFSKNNDGDLSSFVVQNAADMDRIMEVGNKNRSVASTNMNAMSSRSHAIFTITVECSTEVGNNTEGRTIRMGKLNLVDLAGSERLSKTGATGKRLKEATKINWSLSNLGNVISALVDGSSHVPYRNSKLTRLLQDSLGGNAKTVMFANVGPADYNYEETINTLRYAHRVKSIKNHACINEDPKDAMLREYQEEISRLRAQLLQKKAMYDHMANSSEDGENNTKPKTRTRPRTAHTTSSTSSSSSIDTMKVAENERLKELAPLLEPYGLDPATDPKHIMSVLEKRREALLQDTVTVKEEKDRLLKKLEETQQRVNMTETECSKLSDRIQWLESKVLNGGKSLLDHTNEQQKLIAMKQQELAESRAREQDIRLKLAQHELTANEIKTALAVHQAEVEVKTKKLSKLRFKLYSMREELDKSHKEYYRQRKHLVALQADLRRELKLKRLIIENFVPSIIRRLVENRIQQKEKDDGYFLTPVTTLTQTVKRPPVNKTLKLPLYHRSDSGTVHACEGVHYHDENILQLQLEMPKHLTSRYIPPSTNAFIFSLMKKSFDLSAADVVIDTTRFPHRKRSSHSSQSSQHKHGGLGLASSLVHLNIFI